MVSPELMSPELPCEDTNPGVEAAQAAGMAVVNVRGMGSSST